MLLELLFCVLKTIGISTAPPIQHERQYLIVILIYTYIDISVQILSAENPLEGPESSTFRT